VLPRTTPQQRIPHYTDVESLISPGFLSHTLKVGGTAFAIRSLGPGDLFLLRTRTEQAEARAWQLWAIASSIWMVDGHNLLGETHATPRLLSSFQHLPPQGLRILLSTLLGLFARVTRAEEAIEAYNYEMLSRSKWRMLQKAPDFGAGVPGVDRLGTNLVQRLWTAFNEVEDLRQNREHEWESAKLVASSNSPQGVKKIDQKDRQIRDDENNRRQALMDRYYYYRLGLVDQEGFLKDRDRDLVGSRISGSKSVEELEGEMRRWVAGEQDEHDRIVEDYKARILDRQRQVEEDRVARVESMRQEEARREDVNLQPAPLVGYTPAQLEAVLKHRQPGKAGARFVYDEDAAQSAAFLNNRLIARESPGALAVQGGRVLDPEAHPDADQRTLQEMVEGRQVGFSDTPAPSPPPAEVRVAPGQRPEHVSESDWEEYGGKVAPEVFGGPVKPGGHS